MRSALARSSLNRKYPDVVMSFTGPQFAVIWLQGPVFLTDVSVTEHSNLDHLASFPRKLEHC
jgi:hypothetical protein